MNGDRWKKLGAGIWDHNGDGRWSFKIRGYWKIYFQRRLRRLNKKESINGIKEAYM